MERMMAANASRPRHGGIQSCAMNMKATRMPAEEKQEEEEKKSHGATSVDLWFQLLTALRS